MERDKGMIKIVKKLKKLWPRKRRKKIYHEPQYYNPLPPPPPLPPCHCCCSYSTPVQPSAPPLPPWLETEQLQPLPAFSHPIPIATHEIVVEVNTSCTDDVPPTSSSYSYQQYMVPGPVYGVPVTTITQTPSSGRKRSAGFFGCVVGFGVNLIRCICPCFRIREVK